MKEKNWIFFRVMVYVWLAAASGFLILSCLAVLAKKSDLKYMDIYIITAIILSCLQIAFNILNVRLLHHYLFNRQMPPKTFRIWHTLLMALNGCMGILLLLAVYELIRELYIKPAYRQRLGEVITILIISTYLFIMFASIIFSIRLRRFIRKQVVLQEDNWLNQLGTV